MTLAKKNKSANTLFSIAAMMFAVAIVFGSFAGAVKAQAITEGFENITTLPAAGWVTQNNSVPVGTTGWFQGGTTIPAQAGASTSSIQANYQNTTGANTISNWLITPNRTFNNGDVVTFYTRETAANPFPNRLQVRLSTAGTSTNVGTGPTGTGDFTRLLLDINPTYGSAYPQSWTQFTITLSGLTGATSGRLAFRYFVEDGGPDGANSNIIAIDTFAYTPTTTAPVKSPVDFNGDGKTDYSVTRTQNNVNIWFNSINGAATNGVQWGIPTDRLVPADYDGDLKTDYAVWRSGAAGVASFYILNSLTNTVRVEAFGQTGDDPTVVGDYNGDGKADLATYRAGAQSFFYYRTVANGAVTYLPWGITGDKPVVGDYDGDGTTDIAVVRAATPATFIIRRSQTSTAEFVNYGDATQPVAPGDYDGDGKTDICTTGVLGSNRVFNILSRAATPTSQTIVFGLPTDTIVQGDYDGDGKTDIAVWRAGVFYVRQSGSSNATAVYNWGAAGDSLPANFNVH